MNLAANDTTGVTMDENEFWKIIDQSRKGNDYDAQIRLLKVLLTALNTEGIVRFDNTFHSLLAATYNYKLWGASYVINGGCSDDCFEYFREYLIANGKERFYATVNDPESCVTWIKSEDEENWEGLRYAAPEVYKAKTGKEIQVTYQPKYELKGNPFDEATVDKQYPKLAQKFAGGLGDDE